MSSERTSGDSITRLSDRLAAVKQAIRKSHGPEVMETQADLVQALRSAGVGRDAVTVGDRAPDFSLPDQVGAQVRLGDLLKLGSLVLSFFRGAWCPFCENELKALHMALPEIHRRGARLVAISPQRVEQSMTTAERLLLEYSLLSDEGNTVAERYGLAFQIPDSFRGYQDSMSDLAAFNGELSYVLPIPATYVIDQDGTVRYAFVDPDYTRRADPEDVLEVLDGMG